MPAQIFKPQVGRTYLIVSGDYVFRGRVTAWDLETVTVAPDQSSIERKMPESLTLKRIAAQFQEWL